MKTTRVILAWFRQDLRVHDNAMLAEAVHRGLPVIPLYIHAPQDEGDWPAGSASRWWLHHALGSLQQALGDAGLTLVVRRGSALPVLQGLLRELHDQGLVVSEVLINRRYEPALAQADEHIRQDLARQCVTLQPFNSSLLIEPEQIRNQSGLPFRVFTPFWKHLRGHAVGTPVPVEVARLVPAPAISPSEPVEALALLPNIPWDRAFAEAWNPSLAGGAAALDTFISKPLAKYREQRNLPAVEGTSRLSPFLHFGQLGPRQVWAAVHAAGEHDNGGGFTFLSELAWREFAGHLLHHFPDSPALALKAAFRDFPWQADSRSLRAWQTGQTGYPFVDAGMRQLWLTGWMHNRVRMVVASFLVKHLLQPWQDGAAWFWDTLVDADLASNTLGWQWVAGCGADAAPYFRIFNPILQGEKFDPDGHYVRRFVPELARLPTPFIHRPWEAPSVVLTRAGVRLGETYPAPLIEHRRGRERALEALASSTRSAATGPRPHRAQTML